LQFAAAVTDGALIAGVLAITCSAAVVSHFVDRWARLA